MLKSKIHRATVTQADVHYQGSLTLDTHLLHAGDIVLPSEVIGAAGESDPTSIEWRAGLGAALQAAVGTTVVAATAAAARARRAVVGGKLLTNLNLIESVADKAAAFRKFDAAAVDMESLAVARIAAQAHVPFVAARVVVDTAHDALPGAVAAAGRDGPLRVGRLLRGLALAPSDIVGVMRLARRYQVAMRSLALLGSACCPSARRPS